MIRPGPLILALAASVAAMDRLAVVIGNNSGLADETPLQYATQDARQIHAALLQLGGVDKGRDYLLLDADVGQVQSAFEDAGRRIAALRKADRQVQLLIYYSGHGSGEALHLNGKALPLESIRTAFRGMDADLKILIADACFSGSLIQAKGGSLAQPIPVVYQDELKVNGSAILTSSSAGEFAQESKELRGSLFTHYFLSALRGAGDSDHDGTVTLWEAYNHTLAGMRRKLAGLRNVAQTPGFEINLQGSENVVLTKVGLGQSQLTLRGVAEGRYRVVEAAGARPVAEANVTDAIGVTLALPKAAYLVYAAGDERGRAGYADLRKANSVSLQAADFRPVRDHAWAAKGAEPGFAPAGRLEFASRWLTAFPGRAGGATAFSLEYRGGKGPWSASLAGSWLTPWRKGEGAARFEQEALGGGIEIRRAFPVARRLSLHAGPRAEYWSLGQRFGGRDLPRANVAGAFAVAGAETAIPGGVILGVASGPGTYLSYSAAGRVRAEFSAPLGISLGKSW